MPQRKNDYGRRTSQYRSRRAAQAQVEHDGPAKAFQDGRPVTGTVSRFQRTREAFEGAIRKE